MDANRVNFLLPFGAFRVWPCLPDHQHWDLSAGRAGPEVCVRVGAGLHRASSSSSLLLFLDCVALGYVKAASFIFSGFSSCVLK